MSKFIKVVECLSCGSTAKLNQDKRKKLYLNCESCGFLGYKTGEGQKLLTKFLNEEPENGNSNNNEPSGGCNCGVALESVQNQKDLAELPEQDKDSDVGFGGFVVAGLAVLAVVGGLISAKYS